MRQSKPYVAKTKSGAQARVRQLVKQVRERDAMLRQNDVLLASITHERYLLAKLAADTPQFNNPLSIFEAQKIRDRILAFGRAQ